MEKCKADVTICGNDYVLSGDKSEDKIKEIAKYVDDELRHTSKMLNSNPNYRSAVLTAINLAEKLMDNSDLLLKLPVSYTHLRAHETKCSELESAYFDLQMENTNLKNEIRNLQKFRGENE